MSEETESKKGFFQRRKPNGEVERVPWGELSREEQLRILIDDYKTFRPFYDIFRNYKESQEPKESQESKDS